MIYLFLLTANAGPSLGTDFVPFGKNDFVSPSIGEQSDYRLAEFDGMLRPSLRPWIGWEVQNYMIRASCDSYFRRRTRDFEGYNLESHVGAVRLGADLQRRIAQTKKIRIFIGLGIHGNIPLVSVKSQNFSAEEKEEYETIIAQIKSEIGGVGGRLNIAFEHRINDVIGLGFRYDYLTHWTRFYTEEQGEEDLLYLLSEGVVTLAWYF